MAATALVKDLLWRVSVLLGDTAAQFQRFPEKELVNWLTDGQVAIAKYLPSAGARTDAIKLAVGTKQSIDTVLAANCVPGDGVSLGGVALYGVQLLDIVRNMGVDGLTPGKAITYADRSDLDNLDEDWHTKTATSVQDYTFDERLPTQFFVTPGAPASPVMYVELQWNAMPRVIPAGGAPGAEVYLASGGSTQVITIADKFLDDLVNYILARAQLKDAKFADATKTTLYSQMFVTSINAQVAALTGSSPNLQHLPGVQPQVAR